MAGGALANWLDRIFHGLVIDFLELGPLPTINLADLAIFMGLLFFCRDLRQSPT
jgi:lipoprotein signal peptidase